MKWQSVVGVAVVLGYSGFEVMAIRDAQHLFEPDYVLEQFVSMDQAAQRCGVGEAEQRASFLENLAAVRTKAGRALEEQKPDASAAEVERALSERIAAVRGEIDATIAAEGCKGREARKWLLLHEQRARLRIRAD